MEVFLEQFKHLKIQYEVIKSATNSFDRANIIGQGGFGFVYRGELSHFKGHSMVAIKRLNPKTGQGPVEFWKELMILKSHMHENLIALLGFCIQGNERLIVYEYALNGSLDRLISSPEFTWKQRLKTCLDAARGIRYLHNAGGTQEGVIHRDVKSGNILLDANWKAIVSDMGLSKVVPLTQQHTGQFTMPSGTPGYIDPQYYSMSFLTEKSDVYSFGVILLEVLCGSLSYKQPKDFVPIYKKSYQRNALQEIIFDVLKQQIDEMSLKTYSDMAFKCLQESLEERPTMQDVVKELETALKFQQICEVQLPEDYKQMLRSAAIPLNYRSERELKMLFAKGILLNNGKTWFSLDKNGKHSELISIAGCLISTAGDSQHYKSSSEHNSRFAGGYYEPRNAGFNVRVKPQFLSPQTTYTVNLVFKRTSGERYTGLEYKLGGQKNKCYSFLSDEREDGKLTAELYQFTCSPSVADLKINFFTEHCADLQVEGIEFQSVKKEEHEVLRGVNVDTQQPTADTETYWEQKLPIDYADIIRHSKDILQWETKKDLYSLLCRGFPISLDGDEWFSLAKDGKKCIMLSPKTALEGDRLILQDRPGTRFKVAKCRSGTLTILCTFHFQKLTPETTYATYLVYQLPKKYQNYEQPPPLQVKILNGSDSKEVYNIFLSTPKTPVIQDRENHRIYNTSVRPKIEGLPKLRTDSWMEVQIFKFQTHTTTDMISKRLRLSSYDKVLKGITVQGLESRPA